MLRLLRRRWFVGVLSLKIVSTRTSFLGPPIRLDWEGSFGPFETEKEAIELVGKFREMEQNRVEV